MSNSPIIAEAILNDIIVKCMSIKDLSIDKNNEYVRLSSSQGSDAKINDNRIDICIKKRLRFDSADPSFNPNKISDLISSIVRLAEPSLETGSAQT